MRNSVVGEFDEAVVRKLETIGRIAVGIGKNVSNAVRAESVAFLECSVPFRAFAVCRGRVIAFVAGNVEVIDRRIDVSRISIEANHAVDSIAAYNARHTDAVGNIIAVGIDRALHRVVHAEESLTVFAVAGEDEVVAGLRPHVVAHAGFIRRETRRLRIPVEVSVGLVVSIIAGSREICDSDVVFFSERRTGRCIDDELRFIAGVAERDRFRRELDGIGSSVFEEENVASCRVVVVDVVLAAGVFAEHVSRAAHRARVAVELVVESLRAVRAALESAAAGTDRDIESSHAAGEFDYRI